MIASENEETVASLLRAQYVNGPVPLINWFSYAGFTLGSFAHTVYM